MKKYTLLFLVLLSISGYAQNTINNYKYVIVPEKYSFLKQTDQYKLNTLTKALLQDKGFTAYFDNSDLPNEIANNKCGALTVDVLEKNSMFSTNLTIVLKDCYGKTVLESKQGKSREKEFAVSYNLALRDAFTSISDTPYSYQAAADAQNKPAVATTTNASAPASATTTSVPVSANVPVQSAPVSSGLPANASAAVPAGTVAAANAQPAANATKSAVAAESKLAPGTLYAQPTSTGYQLIDTAPKIILSLYKTSVENYFIAGNGTANGIVFKKGDNWVFEYYNNGQLESQKLLIKF